MSPQETGEMHTELNDEALCGFHHYKPRRPKKVAVRRGNRSPGLPGHFLQDLWK